MLRTQMARIKDLEGIRYSFTVPACIIALIDERDAQTFVGYGRRESTRAGTAVRDNPMHGAIAWSEDGRGRRE